MTAATSASTPSSGASGFSRSSTVSRERQQDIANMSGDDITVFVEDEEVQYVRPEMVDHIATIQYRFLTKEQINMVLEHKISALSADQRNLLTPERIKGFRTEKAVNLLNPEQFKLLDDELQLKLVSAQNSKFLSDEARKKWSASVDTTQISLASPDLRSLPPEKQKFLEPKQVQFLRSDEIPLLTDPLVIRGLPRDKFKELDVAQLQHLKDEDLRLLEKPEHLQWALQNGKQKFLHPAQVVNINNTDLKLLEIPILIEAVSDDRLEWLEVKQVAHIKAKNLLQSLKKPEHLREVLKKGLECLLMPKQVSYMDVEDLKLLTDPRLIQEVPIQNLQYLQNSAYQHLLNDDQIEWVISNGKEEHLSDEQISRIEDVESLRDNSPIIQRIPADQVFGLSIANQELISDKQARLAIESMEDEGLDLLKSSKLIQAVPPKRMQFLTVDQCLNFSDLQLECLFAYHSDYMSIITELSSKKPEKLNLLDANSVPTDDALFMESCPESIIHRITKPKVLSKLSETWIKKLQSKQVSLLQRKALKYLDDTQIPHVRFSHLSTLGRAKYSKFTGKQKAYYIGTLIFKGMLAISLVGFVAALFHAPSRQSIGTALKTCYNLLQSLRKKQTT